MVVSTLGVDLGGTTMQGVCLSGGKQLAKATLAVGPTGDPDVVLNRVVQLVRKLVATGGKRPSALGIGLPGLVDPQRGVFLSSPPILPGWKDVPVSAWLQERLGIPVACINDADAALLGEHRFGAARKSRQVALLTLGTGVGGAAMVDGRLLQGHTSGAGEFGHLPVANGGRRCGCGARGCLGTMASAEALLRHYRRHGGTAADSAHDVAKALRKGDPKAEAAVATLAAALTRGLAAVVAALSPELILLGGGVAGLGRALTVPVEEGLRRPYPLAFATVKVRRARLGRMAGAVGAACLPLPESRP